MSNRFSVDWRARPPTLRGQSAAPVLRRACDRARNTADAVPSPTHPTASHPLHTPRHTKLDRCPAIRAPVGQRGKGIQQPSTPQCEDSVAWRTVRRQMRRLVRVSRMTCENLVTRHRDCSSIQPPDPDNCLRCENPIIRQEDYLPDSTTQTTQSLRVRQSAHTLPTRTAPNRRFGVTEGGCASIRSHDDCLGGNWRPMLVGAGGAMRASTRTTAIPTPIAQRLTTTTIIRPPTPSRHHDAAGSCGT